MTASRSSTAPSSSHPVRACQGSASGRISLASSRANEARMRAALDNPLRAASTSAASSRASSMWIWIRLMKAHYTHHRRGRCVYELPKRDAIRSSWTDQVEKLMERSGHEVLKTAREIAGGRINKKTQAAPENSVRFTAGFLLRNMRPSRGDAGQR